MFARGKMPSRQANVHRRRRVSTVGKFSALAGVAPGFVPVLARGVDDAAVGLEELVGDLEDREHQPALRAPCDMAAALFAPDEFAGLAFDALCRAFLVDEAAFEHVSLFDMDVL